MNGKFDDAMRLVQELESSLDKVLYPSIYGDVATLKSDIYTEKGEYDIALEIGLQLLDLAETINNDYLFMKANAALSHYYLRKEKFSKSLSYCLTGLHYIIKLKRTEFFYPKLDEIARMTAQLGNPMGALGVYEVFFELEKRTPPPGDYIKSSVYMNMANIYLSIGQFEMAQKQIGLGLNIAYANNYRFRIPRGLTIQAELYLKQGKTSKAIAYFEKSIDAAENINAFDVIKTNSKIVAKLFAQSKQPEKSKEYADLYRIINDSLYTNERLQRTIILEAKRYIKDISLKKKELEYQNGIQRANLNTLKIFFILFLVLFGVGLFSYLKVKKKNKLLYQRTVELVNLQITQNRKLNGDLKVSTANSKKVSKVKIVDPNKSIDEDIKEIILTKLEKLESKHFFLEPNCNLYQLADTLKTNPKYLSQVINQEKNTNFNNYINGLRINYLLPKLIENLEFRNSKLTYIAFTIGYNNLNTFNDAFKKRLGILPSYFIKELNNDIAVSNYAVITKLKKGYAHIPTIKTPQESHQPG
ncbi:helix-turn-helix domain-containing protein [Arenibacter sp. GZD96]|uniref:helix-turn-helix domain-containing protein n=1 Tax=Aurantibrevibacter litoralis TaxID=3106030 RepID=UPI002AFED656|nr:helix-turn-helix domain-containing protein [Arenibacter sp. GZD-96]MEA1784596.1 helix-turn-helix domain-containing protein [Arenibacter sp. GZD-96]